MDESGQFVVVKMILFFKFKLFVVDGGDEIFQVVEEMFWFLGCEDIVNVVEWQACVNQEFMFYIYENLVYFKVVKEVGIEGMLVLKLVIGKEGVIKDYSISWLVNEVFDVEVLCVVQQMQQEINWVLGVQCGWKVNVVLQFFICFKLEDKVEEIKEVVLVDGEFFKVVE